MSEAAEERLRNLERVVQSLADEVAALRAGLATADPSAVRLASPQSLQALPGGVNTGTDQSLSSSTARTSPAVPPLATPASARGARPERRARSMDLEALVGRYGTLLLGALTIVLGVGVFLSWAVERITLGPVARVSLGALGAAMLGALGLWLRERDGVGTRRFGNAVLALALAVVHLVAWSAGPSLQVVPTQVALTAAAVASLLLAALGWRGGEQVLFVIGTGGALLAPFVTADQVGDPVILLLYGWLVVTASTATLRDERWPWAQRVLTAGVLIYAGAALDVGWTEGVAAGVKWARRDGPAIFVLACVASALLVGGRASRSVLARLWLLVLILPLSARGSLDMATVTRLDLVGLAALGTVGVYLALSLRQARQTLGGASALLQPASFLLAAFLVVPQPLGGVAGALAAGWAALAALAAWESRGQPSWPGEADSRAARRILSRDPTPDVPAVTHLFVAGMLSLGAVALVLRDRPLLAALAVVGHAILAVLLLRRVRHPLLFLTPAFGLLAAAAWVYHELEARQTYGYVPFASAASATALVVVTGWWLCGRLLRDALDSPAVGATERALLGALGPVAAFVWVQAELERAFSAAHASFLVIAYYAVVGVALIALGRRHDRMALRRIGLALAVIAALKAMIQSTDLDAVGLRVGSYLLVGGFLMAVAYWYRGAGLSQSGDDVAGAGSAHDAPERPVTSAERDEG